MTRITKKQTAIMKEVNKRVKNGIKVLDKEFGRVKWLKQIDISALDVGMSSVCICGQIFGDYANAEFKKMKGWSEADNEYKDDQEDCPGIGSTTISDDWATKNGFYLEGDEDFDYDLLTQVWYVTIFNMKVKAGLIP